MNLKNDMNSEKEPFEAFFEKVKVLMAKCYSDHPTGISCLDARPIWAAGLSDTDYDLAMRGSFTVEAAAAYLGVSDRWVREAIKDGRLPARMIGKGYRIQKAHLDSILGDPRS